jgi:DNA-directed RNA polymerase specialized sigma24 family protein
MSDPPPLSADRDCLLAWVRTGKLDSLQPLALRYGALVYAASRRVAAGNEIMAAEITRAVFAVLTRRARTLSTKTVVAAWLFEVTQLAARKSRPSRVWPWRWFTRAKRSGEPLTSGSAIWDQVAPKFDRAMSRLPRKQKAAVLLRYVLKFDPIEAAGILRTSAPRAQERADRGLKALVRRFRKAGCADTEMLARELAENACSTLPDELTAHVADAMAEASSRRPRQTLARQVLTSLARKRWRRRFVVGTACALVLGVLAGFVILRSELQTGFSRSISLFLELRVRWDAFTVRGLTAPAKPWPTDADTPTLQAAQARNGAAVYGTTNIWLAHLQFSRDAWKELEPRRIAPLPNFVQPNGELLLRNPKAQRGGLAGVIGFEFDWCHAEMDFGGMRFTNVAARVKGNGSHLLSLYGEKRALKVDLNKYAKGQKLAGLDELVFNNLVADSSYLSDALGYEFFRDAGVPTPRTAFAYLTLSVQDKYQGKPLGLYVMVEPVDRRFAADRFGSRKVPIFKPVTYELFESLGDDWSAYAEVYDVKTEATPEQQRRVIDFSRLVSYAGDAEFAERVGDFLDLEAFARFLAGQVILSNYDSLLFDGQNYYLYLDPASQKFGFIPWDLDQCWGGFALWLTEERERANIWHPWVGKNRFLARVMEVEEFRKRYRASLEDYLARLFVPERLFRRMDELAKVIRPAVAAESDFRLQRFEQAVSDHWPELPPRGGSEWADRPVHQLKRFIVKRAHYVRLQLDNKTRGLTLKRPARE